MRRPLAKTISNSWYLVVISRRLTAASQAAGHICQPDWIWSSGTDRSTPLAALSDDFACKCPATDPLSLAAGHHQIAALSWRCPSCLTVALQIVARSTDDVVVCTRHGRRLTARTAGEPTVSGGRQQPRNAEWSRTGSHRCSRRRPVYTNGRHLHHQPNIHHRKALASSPYIPSEGT